MAERRREPSKGSFCLPIFTDLIPIAFLPIIITILRKGEIIGTGNSTMDKNLHILILEDRVSDAELMEFELADAGIDCTSRLVETEKDYVLALQDFSPDLILSDYDLPQYSGALALAAAKRLCPEVPFILVTGAVDKCIGLYDEILAQGARGCVLKSHLERLAPSVRKVFRANTGDGKAADRQMA